MKIAFIVETFAPEMGYLANVLPRVLASRGHSVHVYTTTLPPAGANLDSQEAYSEFLKRSKPTTGTSCTFDGVTVHFLKYRKTLGYTQLIGLWTELKIFGPDVIQAVPAIGWVALQPALAARRLRVPFFSGSHTTLSVFPLARERHLWSKPHLWGRLLARWIPGRMISLATTTCYAATVDCADVAQRFFGVRSDRLVVAPLGVDTDIMYPRIGPEGEEERAQERRTLGFSETDVVYIYTGRFSAEKNPILLAEAICELRRSGIPARGLFIGEGPQRTKIALDAANVVVDFMPHRKLGRFYRASDVGVWPTQESMSMMDAAACGLPIIVNDTVRAVERFSGNGLTYRLGSVESLVEAMRTLSTAVERQELGDRGATKMREQFSWQAAARRRESDYAEAISRSYRLKQRNVDS